MKNFGETKVGEHLLKCVLGGKVNEFGDLRVNGIGVTGNSAAPNTFISGRQPKTVHLSAAATPKRQPLIPSLSALAVER